VGWVVAAFFVAVFPGNISQYLTGTPAFGLDSDAARLVRLLFQPVLVGAALWSRVRGRPGARGGRVPKETYWSIWVRPVRAVMYLW
jgi:uncharacterized membrane protein